MNRHRLWITLLSGCAALVLAACGAGEADPATTPLKIAVVAPFDEKHVALGDSSRNGVVLAVEEWNQRGGVLGRSIQVVLKDSQCDYIAGREAAQAALNDGANFIIGGVCSNESEGIAQVVMESDALQIIHAATHPDLVFDNDGLMRERVFRVPFSDPVQGTAAAQFALERLQAKTAAILTLEGDDYGTMLSTAFQTAFEAGKGDIARHEVYELGADDLYKILEKIRDENADVLYMPGYYNGIASLVMQARSFGLLQPVLGSDGWNSSNLNLSNINDCYFTTHYFAGESRPAVQTWIQNYETRYMIAPDTLATLAYDTTNMLLAGIQEARSLDPAHVAKALKSMTFETITGRVTFDENHNAVKDVLILKVQNGQLLLEERFVVKDIAEEDTP
ncbi:MAG: ABC transporter substrate-binding protein [Anaerolineae bacterium]|nr:ABC transporter substrate-binding protein [Anaerolineae bacterium]